MMMIADPMGTYFGDASTYYTSSPTYYYYLRAPRTWSATYYYAPDPKPTKKELAIRWWKYVATFTPRLEVVAPRVIQAIRAILLPRIHHERQYPRVIKYRNNRLP